MDRAKMVSIKNAEHYTWGQLNSGWHLLKNNELSVIEESMEPGTSEQLHFHRKAQQLFYILSGKAGLEINQQLIQLNPGESIHIPPGIPHMIYNNGDIVLRFIVISAPKSQGDRVNVDG